MLLPVVRFCGLNVTRLVLGANPFGGFSHQDEERDRAMREYHTVSRIKETWDRAAAAGINTMVTNNETVQVVQAVRDHLGAGGPLQWIAQVMGRGQPEMRKAVDEVTTIGCKALYFHGALVDDAYRRKDVESVRMWCDYARSKGVPAGVASHAPEVHRWVNDLDVADFHAVCFFNCGSLHAGKGHRFRLADVAPAVACIREIRKPCIGYKIMGAGRIDPLMAFEYALEGIKPGDVVNVGMYRGDRDDMVEANAAMVRKILES